MREFLYKPFCFLSGWRIEGNWPENVKRSVICFAPHTSFYDGFIGKFLFWGLGIPHRCLMAGKYFNWFTTPFLKFFGFVPVGTGQKNAIRDSVGHLKGEEDLNILICPEGHLRAIEDWNKGFLLIAKMAEVPIVLAYMDYPNKRGGILGTIKADSWEQIKLSIIANYKKEWAKYPEKFEFPK